RAGEELLDRARQDAAGGHHQEPRALCGGSAAQQGRGREAGKRARPERRGSRSSDAPPPFLRAVGRAAAGGDRARRGRSADTQARGVDRLHAARLDRTRRVRVGVRAALTVNAPLRMLLALACAGGAGGAHATTTEIGPGSGNFRAIMQGLHAGDTLILDGGTYSFSGYFELDLAGSAA